MINGFRQAAAHNISFGAAAQRITPFAIAWTLGAVWVYNSYDFYEHNFYATNFFIHGFGFTFAYICTRIIIDRIAQERTPNLYLILIPLGIFLLIDSLAFAAANSYTHYLPESYVLVAYCGLALLQFSHLFYNIALQIADIQQIYIFSTKKYVPNKSDWLGTVTDV